MRALALILFLTFTVTAKAEYNGYFIKFTIEKTNGEKATGHSYVTEAYLNQDSLQNTDYLKKVLDYENFKDWNGRQSLTYYKHRIKYEYSYPSNTEDKNTIYSLAETATVPFSSIKSIKIEEMLDFGYLMNVASPLKISDTSWMKKEPVKVLQAGGYLCSYTIFVHKNSKRIDELAKILEKKQQEIDARYNELENGYDNGNGDIVYPEKDYHALDKLDEEIYEIIAKFINQKKLVVISYCTC